MQKKNSNLFGLIGFVAFVLTIGALLFLFGTGISVIANKGNADPSNLMGYYFIFGNNAQQVYTLGAMVAAWTLSLIAVVFQLLGLFFSFGEGKKFAAFLNVVSALCLIATAVIYFLATKVEGNFLTGDVTYKLGWGFIAAGACAGVSALLDLVFGFKEFLAK
jgi:hypothetical protein